MIQEKPLRNKVFLPLSTINSVVGEKSMEDVESFFLGVYDFCGKYYDLCVSSLIINHLVGHVQG